MYDMMSKFFDAARFNADVHSVIALRCVRMASGGPAAATEAHRMIAEKIAAFGEAQSIFLSALFSGQSFESTVADACAPYMRCVRANQIRLLS